jgi:hypothetical protein
MQTVLRPNPQAQLRSRRSSADHARPTSDTSRATCHFGKGGSRTEGSRDRHLFHTVSAHLCVPSVFRASQVYATSGMGGLLHRILNGTHNSPKRITIESQTPFTNLNVLLQMFSMLTAAFQIKQVEYGSGRHQPLVDLSSTIKSLRVSSDIILQPWKCIKRHSIFT